jgi:hypothetical protein
MRWQYWKSVYLYFTALERNLCSNDTDYRQNCFLLNLCLLRLLANCGVMFQNWTIHGLYWGSYLTHRPAVLIDSLNELLSWLSKGLITVQISHTYRLPEVSNIKKLHNSWRLHQAVISC